MQTTISTPAHSSNINPQNHYRYRLGRRATYCPQCGHREFKPYVDTQNNDQPLDPSCGRCNREIKCAYHLTPSEFFRQNPGKRPGLNNLAAALNACLARLKPIRTASTLPTPWVTSSQRANANRDLLFQWLIQQFGLNIATTLCALYSVGHTPMFGGATIYWLVDHQLRVRSGKIMAYDANGHRRRTLNAPAVTFVHTLRPSTLRFALNLPLAAANGVSASAAPMAEIPEDYNYIQCFFGSKLLQASPDATILLVESEKTALYLAGLLLQSNSLKTRYLPIATGGCAGLNISLDRLDDPDYRFAPLYNRRIILLPDVDATDKWHSYLHNLRLLAPQTRLLDLRPLASHLANPANPKETNANQNAAPNITPIASFPAATADIADILLASPNPASRLLALLTSNA
jgi:hypothetical protein